MCTKFGENVSQELAKYCHVNRQNVKILGKVALGKYVVNQVNHYHQCHLFIKFHHSEDHSCHDIESLAVASVLVESGVCQKDLLEDCTLLIRRESSVACAMEIFDNLNPQGIIPRRGILRESCAKDGWPVQR